MATAKKTTARTTSSRAKTTTKPKVASAKVAKTAPVKAKSAAPKKRTASKKANSQAVSYKTFKLAPDVPSIYTFKITRQTIYWIIIMAFIIFFQLWIIKLQIEVAQLVNYQQTQIELDGGQF